MFEVNLGKLGKILIKKYLKVGLVKSITFFKKIYEVDIDMSYQISSKNI